jgi:hypothetical protein
VVLVSDWNNHVVRVLDFDNDTVSSVCVHQSSDPRVTADGSAKTCKLEYPMGLLYRDGRLYVGQNEAIATIPCK